MQRNKLKSRKFVLSIANIAFFRAGRGALGLLLFSALLLPSMNSTSFGKCFQKEEIARQEAQAKAKAEKAEAGQQRVDHAQDADVGGKGKDVEKKKDGVDDAEQETADVIDTAIQPAPPSMADDQIKLHMWDGSIVGGSVSVNSIDVLTEFGMLTIPIKEIVAFYPGLDSFPQKKAHLEQLVQDLGDGTYQVREDAHRTLVKIGLPLKSEIEKFVDGGSMERKKHLVEIRKELNALIEEAEELDEPIQVREMVKQDKVVTRSMTVVGKIQTDLFNMTSKFGELKVRLEDIEFASRDIILPKEDVRKTITVNSDNFFQRKPKSTGIRVNKGDRIRIRASGSMEWTNWGKSSSPEGLSSQGTWNSIQSGTLMASIGKDEKGIVKVGSKEDWVAKRSGVLYLSIAIQDNYVKNNGYRWTGDYEAKVVVSPVAK